jgi:hypothetical protein
VRLGYGFWVGYPVAYPYYYPYPVPYPYPAPTYSGTINLTPNASGGLSFDIAPPNASVFVDGQYVGTVNDFSPRMPPLWLVPGRHYVEVRSPGYEPLMFDVDVVAGQVIPYEGTMRRE